MKNILFTTILFLSFCRLEIPKDKIPELGLLSALMKVKSVVVGATGTTDTGTGTNTGTATGSASSSSPTFSPVAGQYNTPQSITISTTTTGATVYYTTDGTDPTSASNQYTSPIHIWSIAGKTIKAISIKSGLTNSTIATATYSYPPLKTGQTSCYDGSNNAVACSSTYKGQDGQENQGVARSYTDNGNGTVTDNVTGLIWQKCYKGRYPVPTCSDDTGTTDTTTTWDEAVTYCSSLNLASQTWRLPNIEELSTLVDAGKSSSAAINTDVFPIEVVQGHWFWSSSVLNDDRYFTHFYYATIGSYNKATSNGYVRCVTGNTLSISNFLDNGDWTIKDNRTGLIWQKCPMGKNNDQLCTDDTITVNHETWSGAINYCNTLSLAGKVWRLPNRNELQSIMDYSLNTSVGINETFFPTTGWVSGTFWNSNTDSRSSANTLLNVFGSGYIGGYGKTSIHQVRCVSGP